MIERPKHISKERWRLHLNWMNIVGEAATQNLQIARQQSQKRQEESQKRQKQMSSVPAQPTIKDAKDR